MTFHPGWQEGQRYIGRLLELSTAVHGCGGIRSIDLRAAGVQNRFWRICLVCIRRLQASTSAELAFLRRISRFLSQGSDIFRVAAVLWRFQLPGKHPRFHRWSSHGFYRIFQHVLGRERPNASCTGRIGG